MAEEGNPKPPHAPTSPKLQLKVSDELAKGSYANFVVIHNNEAEFVLDFVFVEPQRPVGQVVSRVLVNPRTAKKLLVGMTKLLENYEKRFGEIAAPDPQAPQGTYH